MSVGYLAALTMAGREAANYAWLITTDHLAEGDRSDVDRTGPVDAPADVLEHMRNDGLGFGPYEVLTWRCRDDDWELYYTGKIAVLRDRDDDEVLCSPLWEYAQPGAGAVSIEYLQPDGSWLVVN
jgi:hypothetical protein